MTIQEAGDIIDRALGSDIAKKQNTYSGTGKYTKENLSSVSQLYRYEGKAMKIASYTVYFNFGFTGKHSPRNISFTTGNRDKASRLMEAGVVWLDHLNIPVNDEIDF